MKRPARGIELLLEHAAGLEEPPQQTRTGYERLCCEIGPDLAGMLVRALSVPQGSRRRTLVA